MGEGLLEPSPYSILKLIAPSAVGVMVTKPVLSCVTSKDADTLVGGATLAKSVLSLKFSSHPTNRSKTKIEQNNLYIFFMFIV